MKSNENPNFKEGKRVILIRYRCRQNQCFVNWANCLDAGGQDKILGTPTSPGIEVYNVSVRSALPASLVVQTIKNLPAMQETQVPSLVERIPWRREWQPTPIFLPGEFHGERSLGGYSPWGLRESDTTE